MAEILDRPVEWVPIGSLKRNPRNRNIHTPEGIAVIAKLIQANKWRHPIIVSTRSGLIAAGDGRLSAAELLKMDKVPVHYQDFASEEEEYQFGIADNASQGWSTLDLAGVHQDLPNLAPFDLELLAIENFNLEPVFDPGTEGDQGKLDEKKPIECPNCHHVFTT